MARATVRPMHEKVRGLAAKGLTQAEAARELGVSKQRVSQLAAQLGLAFPPAWSRPKAAGTELGRVVQAARLASGYSYVRLAALSGLHKWHLKAIERGWVRRPRAKTLRALADCLAGHTSYEELVRAVPGEAAPVRPAGTAS